MTQVRLFWYFILEGIKGGIKHNEKFLRNLNVRTKMYYFRDDTQSSHIRTKTNGII